MPGTPELEAIRREIWDDNDLGNAIPGATPRARIDVRTLVPGLPLIAPRRPADARPDARAQPVDARLSRAGQLRPPAGPPRRAVVRRRRRADQPRFRARLAARQPAAGRPPTSPIEIPVPPDAPGRYALKFDLVSEGIDWFERCGSETTIKPLVVR